MEGFKVPFALDGADRLVAPEDASRRAQYRCPLCMGVVDLHAGEQKRRHFHHRGGPRACAAESVSHLVAKELIARAIMDWKDGGEPPKIVRRCASEGCARGCTQEMPRKVLRAELERKLPNGRVVDVALVGPGDLCIAAVEVLQTHAVDDDKARELGVPWLEVSAEQVCATAGRVLDPVTDRLLPWLCDEHAPARKARAKQQREEQLSYAALLRALPFALEDYPGFRVEGTGTCARGHAALVFAWEGREPPFPRPPLVVARHADADHRYDAVAGRLRAHLPFRRSYVSACPLCGEPVSLT